MLNFEIQLYANTAASSSGSGSFRNSSNSRTSFRTKSKKKKTNFNYLHILISRVNSIKMIFCNYVSIEKNSVEIQNLPSSFSFNGTENTPANRPTRMNLINIVQRVLFQGPSTSYIPIVLYTNRLCDKVHVASKCVSFHLLLLINLVEWI